MSVPECVGVCLFFSRASSFCFSSKAHFFLSLPHRSILCFLPLFVLQDVHIISEFIIIIIIYWTFLETLIEIDHVVILNRLITRNVTLRVKSQISDYYYFCISHPGFWSTLLIDL